jgi:hypothetical protein
LLEVALLSYFLTKLIRLGSLEVEAADGSVATYGDGTGRRARVKVMDRAAEWALMTDVPPDQIPFFCSL